MSKDFPARQSIVVHAPMPRVWDAFVNPDVIKQYMFGTTVVSNWKVGSPIVWKGEWNGKSYEDKGVILRLEPEKVIQYSYFSPLSGLSDTPENYHTITIELSRDETDVRVSLTQENNPSEQAREHSEKNWAMALARLKNLLEG